MDLSGTTILRDFLRQPGKLASHQASSKHVSTPIQRWVGHRLIFPEQPSWVLSCCHDVPGTTPHPTPPPQSRLQEAAPGGSRCIARSSERTSGPSAGPLLHTSISPRSPGLGVLSFLSGRPDIGNVLRECFPLGSDWPLKAVGREKGRRS